MDKRRVYQVAKEQKLSSDALISMLKGMGHDVKSHMSVVTDEMLAAITRKITEEKQSSIEEVKRQREKERTRKEAERAPQPAAPREADGRLAPKRKRDVPLAREGVRVPPALPEKEAEGRRRSKRRGRTTEGDLLEEMRGGLAEKREVTAQPDASAGLRRRGGGKRRRGADVRQVQETVRKTLSQMKEGRTRRRYERGGREDEEGGAPEATRTVRLSEFITLAEFAEAMGVKPSEAIAVCLQMGVMATMNQRLDMDTMATVGLEFGVNVVPLDAEEAEELEEVATDEEGGEAVPRPPVVTVMGHVDHGKTSLLDYLRKTNVAAGESGGITQHIGAYVVKLEDGRAVTFLDTPGHSAFTAMRARGARVTDLVILVVAADDSVMPQTIEAISHARDAQVPIVVAINKVDLPTADPERIKRELADRGVLIEAWGGSVPSAEISAKRGTGVAELLELLLISAELLELQAVAGKRARGTIIEAKLDKGRGPVATVLVQEGTLREGDPFVTGVYGGRVRALLNEHGERLREAGPSIPVQVLGLPGVPQAGDQFVVAATERDARELSQRRQQVKREQEYRRIRRVTLSDLHDQIRQGQVQELRVIVKADVDGSVEAINQELGSITHEEVRVAVIHSGVGPISESDVLLASASNAIVIGFRVQADASARDMATQSGVEIRQYKVIYEVLEDIRAALSGLLAPSLEEHVVGAAEVRQVFTSSRAGTVAGCMVQKGKIGRSNRVRVVRGGDVVFTGAIGSLRRFKDDVREVAEGFECGISVEGFSDYQEGDVIEALEVVETARTL
ncbi:MAG: translation initiation factor IF-2 [Candidatus Latescibacterota bacterium]